MERVVVPVLLILVCLILASIPIKGLDVLWGNIFHSWQNTLMFIGGVLLLVIVVTRFK